MDNIALEIKQVAKQYGSQQALKDFDLTVKEGDIVGIAGRNGAGKTTLFRIITGLTPQYNGSVSIFGSKNARELNQQRHLVGTIIEDPAFIPEMTAAQNLEFYRLERGISDKSRVNDMLELVGLAQTGRKKVKDFSLGMKQRLAIALALIHRPKLLIFDEPTNGLDPEGIIQVRELLLQLAKDDQLTILVSSHILSELEHLATRFVIIEKGQKIEAFTKEELQEKIQSYYELNVSEPERAISLIKEAFKTTNIEQDGTDGIKIFDLSLSLADIADLLVHNGIRLSHLTRKTHLLETVFLDLIKGGQSDDKLA